MIPSFRQLKQIDRVLQQLQANVAAVLSALYGTPVVQGAIASFTPTAALSASVDIQLQHGLGRAPVGILPLVGPFFATWQQSATRNTQPTLQAILNCSSTIQAGQTCSFWVF